MSYEDDLIAAAEQSLAEVGHFYRDGCLPPLYWHPFYRGKTWLLDWLNGEGEFAKVDPIRFPIIQRATAVLTADADIDPVGPSFKVMTLTKQRAWGPAPWVGKPFHYEWYVGTDDLGRHIAGESKIVYETGLRLWEQMGPIA